MQLDSQRLLFAVYPPMLGGGEMQAIKYLRSISIRSWSETRVFDEIKTENQATTNDINMRVITQCKQNSV